MVKTATNFGNNGLQEWLLQRISAIILLIYTIILILFLILNPNMNYIIWKNFFNNLSIKILTLLSAASLIIHLWIGLWIISTDYIKLHFVKLLLQFIINITLIIYLIIIINTLWSIPSC